MTQLFRSRLFGSHFIAAVAATALCSASFAQTLHRSWVRTHNAYPQKTNRAQAIAVTPDGNLVVAGSCNAYGPQPGFDYAIIKYSPNGDELWRTRYDLLDDSIFAMAIDPAGNVIVT